MASSSRLTRYKGWRRPMKRAAFFARAIGRYLRVTKPVTALLGPQYARSRDQIEIDITYQCNLRCLNCSRSCGQAPSEAAMNVRQIDAFVRESKRLGKRWRRIRVLGGEPTLHPQLRAILDVLLEGLGRPDGSIVELVTHGFGPDTQRVLDSLPDAVVVENSHKTSATQPTFRVFSVAPVDLARFRFASFRNGCEIAQTCGLGLTPYGYYCCAVAGGIDRVAGYDLGRKQLPPDDDAMLDQLDRFCALCGLFLDGHLVPWNQRKPLLTARVSKTWRRLYTAYGEREPALSRYG